MRTIATTKSEMAAVIISRELEPGQWTPCRHIIDRCVESGCGSKEAIQFARESLGVQTRKSGFGAGWEWIIPEA